MPKIYLIAGCNGSGKSTISQKLLPEILECKEFINADGIASGLSPFHPEKVAIKAGKLMLDRIRELSSQSADFAIETTLSGQIYVQHLKDLKVKGYIVILVYLFLSSPELAIKRVAERVQRGGTGVANDVIIRRYHRGLTNLRNLYLSICDYWIVYDNSGLEPVLVAEGKGIVDKKISNSYIWDKISGIS